MPYFEYAGEENPVYESASGRFQLEKFNPDSRYVYEVLRTIGVKEVYCNYNGGADEEFAEFSGAKLEDRILEVDDLMPLIDSELGSKNSDSLDNYYGNADELSPELRVEFFLETFACNLAIQLLGSDYGTGEFSIDGSFKANLETGEIIDEPNR